MTAVDLFCGMGGTSAGLAAAGLRVALAVDGWDKACAAHRRWHPMIPVVRARIEALPVDGVKPWLLWASPSCKPWSTANRTPKRGKAHPEHYSTALLVRQAVEMGARWLVMENVGGLLWSKEGKAELAEMRAECQRLGLCWYASIVNSNTIGVAQIRRRLIIVVGSEYVRIPHGADYIPPESATNDPVGTSTNPHTGAVNAVGQGVAVRPVTSTESEHGYYQEYKGKRYDYGRTLADCAALQQVPMEPLAGMSKRVAHELVGNAVPPPLAEHVARTLLKHDASAG